MIAMEPFDDRDLDLSARADILALVLAGGQSRRMGRDKALIELEGKPLLRHVLDRVRREVQAVAIAAGADAARLAAYSGDPILLDPPPFGRGPLAGLAAGFDWMAARHPTCDWLLCLPVDMPFLPPGLALRLYDAAQASSGAAVVYVRDGAGRDHFLPSLWRRSLCQPSLQDRLRDQNYKVGDLIAALGGIAYDWNDHARQGQNEAVANPFLNVNGPDDLPL